MNKIGIFFGSTTGNTESAASKIGKYLGGVEVFNVGNTPLSQMDRYDVLILGSSTWGSGDLQDDWEPLLKDLSKMDFSGKRIAFFGSGDQVGYPDTFVDAMGILYAAVRKSNAQLIGTWPAGDYDFNSSRALVDGQFVGLAIDDDNQDEMTDTRIRKWVDELKSEI